MIYPYIYTGTRYYDFRVVTSQMLRPVPLSVGQFFTEVACAMIKAENSQLIAPSWALVKKEGYILWGIAILNNVLGNQSYDDDARPVRGFFGFISDTPISRLPYDISYFKTLYATYVAPIWDSHIQTQEIVKQMPPISGVDFIEKSSRLNEELNFENDICRIFPSSYDSKTLVEAAFSSLSDCSIACNVHSKKQCVEFGTDKISFNNAVVAPDLKISKIDDVRVFVPEETPVDIHEKRIDDDIIDNEESFCSICGRPVNENENVCQDCVKKQRNKKYVTYGLYGFMAIICLLLMFNGNSIWEKILSPKHQQEKVYNEEDKQKGQEGRINTPSSFLTTTKQKVNVSDANPDDIFKFAYESSSLITQVEPTDNWIRIMTSPQQFSEKGIIEFTCDPLLQGRREGAICITNDEGIKTIIPIYQTVSIGNTDVDNTYHSSHGVDNKATLHNVTVGESDVESSGDAQNFGTTPIVEPVNH